MPFTHGSELAIKQWGTQHEHMVFSSLEQAGMYLVCTYYLLYLYRMKKGDIKPAMPQLLFCVHPVRAFLALETRATFAGMKTWGVQA